MGEVTGEMAKDNITIRRGNANAHRHQEIVERFYRTLDERLFTFQYSPEMNFRGKEICRMGEEASRNCFSFE